MRREQEEEIKQIAAKENKEEKEAGKQNANAQTRKGGKNQEMTKEKASKKSNGNPKNTLM